MITYHANTSERRKAVRCLYLLMENNQNTNPQRPNRKQLAPRDMIILALAILVLTRINWTQLNSFHILILFLLFLMLMLRWANMRKEAVRKQAMERYRSQYEDELIAMKIAEDAAKAASADDATIDGETAPAAEAEEKSEV